ncbi:MAG TPA: MFS transporter [Verrucomicrobiae bacterium]|jgi:PAT family beta-lactamase induction signal transducer AmpG
MAGAKNDSRSPWLWIPTVYFMEGMPNALIATVSVLFFHDLGVSNAATAFYTSLLYLPWVIKPLWSPAVDILKTRRQWIWSMQLLLGIMLGGVALMVPAPHFVQWTVVFFCLLAFSSATHDIAADGFYILANPEHRQSFFIGWRNICFNGGVIAARGGMVFLAGWLIKKSANPALAWSIVFLLGAAVFVCLSVYHHFILPRPAVDIPKPVSSQGHFLDDFLDTFAAFFRKPKILWPLLFILSYRLGEAQMLKIVPIFLRDPHQAGGLALDNEQVSLVYGTAGAIAFVCGALLGGFLVARHGLRSWLWPMLLAIHLPDAVFIWLAYAQPQHLDIIGVGVALEQFGYGFGFTAFMIYLLYVARGEQATAHYAICTGFMAAGLMIPGLWSGALQSILGYKHFFLWTILATIPSFLTALKLPLDPEFGKRSRANQ